MAACAHTEYQSHCVGTTVTLPCSAHGTLLIWSSEEYVGRGGNHLEFGTFSTPRNPIYSQEYNKTFAVLLRIHNDFSDNFTIIESELTVMISQNGSISCMDDNNYTVFNVSIIASK